MKRIVFFVNGNVGVTLNGRDQEPELQRGWAELYAEFLEGKGQNPVDFELTFPDGATGRFFKTEDGYNWEYNRTVKFKGNLFAET